MGGNKVRLETRKSKVTGSWYTIVTEVNGQVLDQKSDIRRVTNMGHITRDGITLNPGHTKFHGTRKIARAAVKVLQGNFPGTEYTGGLH